MSSPYRPTYYEVSLQRQGSPPRPISRDEWLAAVSADADLAAEELSGTERKALGCVEAWKMKSHPEGTPIYFDGSRAFIREDDARTIEKLVALAERLESTVEGEDGTVFFDIGGATPNESVQASEELAGRVAPSRRVRVPLHDERIRKRQAGVVVVLGLIPPLYTGWMLMQGNDPGELFLWSPVSLALSAWAGVRMSLLRYFLEWNGGRTVTVHLPDTRSTEDRIAAKEFAHSQLNPLELIWFPLEYPGKTVIEYHVRSQKLPWLVFLAGGNKKRSQDLLKSLGEQLFVGVVDKSESKPAKNVPKKFQLSDAEKKKR